MHHRTASDYEKLDKEMDYEEKNLPSRQIIIWVSGLLAGLVIVMLVMYCIVGVPKAVPRPDIVTSRKMLAPTLQHDPPTDLKKFKAEQHEHMTSYGWVDKKAGVVHLPIDVAIDLSLQRGMFPHEGKK